MGGPGADDTVLQRIDDAAHHGLLQLAHCDLRACPRQLFSSSACCAALLRVDLSGNLIATLPDAIAQLTNLQFLWLRDNPKLCVLPSSLAQCTQLRVLDVRETAMRSLPCELATLAQLLVLDIGDTPLETKWIHKRILIPSTESPFSQQSQHQRCQQIRRSLTRKHERTLLKQELFDVLHDSIYLIERSDVASDVCLERTIQRVLKKFPQSDEIRSVLRSAERLFPSIPVPSMTTSSTTTPVLHQALETLDASQFRAKFDHLQTELERTKKAADLELKIRALYFDRIDPSAVSAMVQSVYREITTLRDVKFLLRHATALFPPNAKDVDGKSIHARLVALQQELARERQSAVDKLLVAVKAVYSDTEPEQVKSLVAQVASLFKNTKDLRSLAADAAALFPIEFLNAQASEIRAAFQQQKAETLGTVGAGSGMSSSGRSRASKM